MTDTPTIKMLQIRCPVKKYHWGGRGSSSIVAQLIKNQNADFSVDEESAYAELWMGTHPSGPAIITSKNPQLSNQYLSFLLHQAPELVGTIDVVEKYGRDLPFLFKILSIKHPLSIQSHPDKDLAKILHEKDPLNYPDSNHKPEMAIAISPFEALVSFKPLSELKQNLENFRELRNLIGEETVNSLLCSSEKRYKEQLANCFSALMKSTPDAIKTTLEDLKTRLVSDNCDPTLKELFNRLYAEYPDDIGCFSVFFFNHVKLQSGEAIFLPANEPHAYLSGECIECMACSDNVIRAGLTPKYKDIKTLCYSLSYQCKSKQEIVFKPHSVDNFTSTYRAAADEFAVDLTKIKVGDTDSYDLPPRESGSILLVLEGEAVLLDDQISPGYICFISAQTATALHSIKSDLTIFRAYCPIRK